MNRLQALLTLLMLSSACIAFDISGIRAFDAGKYQEYPEIGGIRQNIMLSYYSQGRESIPPGFPEFADASLEYMRRFGEAYTASSSGETDALLRLPRAAGFASSALEHMEGTARDSIPLSKYGAYLARSSFERYISSEAERLKGLGDSEPRTKKKLAYYEAASSLYGHSKDKVKASEARSQYFSLQSSYSADILRADSLFGSAQEQCIDAKQGEGEWFGLPSYVSFRQCTASLLEARNAYVAHTEEDRLRALDSQLASAEEAMGFISQKVWMFFISLAIMLVALNVLVLSRVREWNADGRDSSLGSEVLRWKKG